MYTIHDDSNSRSVERGTLTGVLFHGDPTPDDTCLRVIWVCTSKAGIRKGLITVDDQKRVVPGMRPSA